MSLKQKILNRLIQDLEDELSVIKDAAKHSKELVGEADLRQESKYDTRAIEASYLASAQLKRVEELELDIQMLKEVEIHDAHTVEMGSLVTILHNGQARLHFLSPVSGGNILEIEGQPVLIISVFSPIGAEAIGLSVGDSFEVETPKGNRLYEIREIH